MLLDDVARGLVIVYRPYLVHLKTKKNLKKFFYIEFYDISIEF